MFELLKTIPCMACKDGHITLVDRDSKCETCGSELHALVYLIRRGILPQDMHDELYLRPRYAGITMEIAKKLVTIFKDTSDQPN